MANEFIARNGLIAQNNSVITGSLNVTSNITGSRLFVSSSGTSTLRIQGSGSELVTVDGATGRLFTVSDDLSDSLFSVNTISGLPVIEAFATNDVNIGRYGTYPIKTTATGTLAVITGSFTGSMVGNLTGTASFASNANVFPFTGSALITGSLGVTGSLSTRAQGALSTDIAFRVRNSADSANLIESRGNGHLIVTNTNFADVFTAQNSLESFRMGGGNLNYVRATQSGNLQYIIRNGASSNALITLTAGPANQVYWENLFDFDTVSKNVTIFGGSSIARGNSGDSVMWVRSGTSTPSSNFADMFGLYSADRNGVAGKASPHFRTEDGTTVWLGDESRLFNVTASRTIISSSQNTISGSSLTVYGSGSTQPVFTVQGSQGELFSVTDSLSGSLFSVNDISGLPILEVFSDNTTLIGNYLDPMLITTAKVTQTNSGSFTVYSLPTASYDTAFFEYSVRSGSNARAGTIMAIQSGSSVNFTETTTTAFGTTTAISFVVIVTGSNMALTGSSTSGAWTTKCIIRGI